jgi:hypothetical protein
MSTMALPALSQGRCHDQQNRARVGSPLSFVRIRMEAPMLQKLLNAIRGLFGRKSSTPSNQGVNVSDRRNNPPNKPQP